MAKAFISYTHGDEGLKDRLIAHLASLKHEKLIDVWHDRMLGAGEHLDPAIQAKLAEADLIILLVSADFISSRYCYEEEMLRAFERRRQGQAIVVAVILRPCQWATVPLRNGYQLGDFLALPRDGKPVTKWNDPEEAFDNVVAELRRILIDRCGSAAPIPTLHVSAANEDVAQSVPFVPAARLRLPAQPTDHDKDRFLRTGFNATATLFETRLIELEVGDERVTTDFERVDSRCFIARIYVHGKDVGGAKLFYGGEFMQRSISLSFDTSANRNSMNDWIAVEADREGLHFKASNMGGFGRQQKDSLDVNSAAEYLWDTVLRHVEARIR